MSEICKQVVRNLLDKVQSTLPLERFLALSSPHSALISLLGDKAALVRQYQQLQRLSQQDLKAEPFLTTQRLYQQSLLQLNRGP